MGRVWPTFDDPPVRRGVETTVVVALFLNLLAVICGYSKMLIAALSPDDPNRVFVSDIQQRRSHFRPLSWLRRCAR